RPVSEVGVTCPPLRSSYWGTPSRVKEPSESARAGSDRRAPTETRRRRTLGWAPLRLQKCLDGAALVHRAMALGHLIERQRQVEDFSGIDRPFQYQFDQLGQVPAHRCRSAMQTDVRVEQLLAIELDAVREADVAD